MQTETSFQNSKKPFIDYRNHSLSRYCNVIDTDNLRQYLCLNNVDLSN